MSIMKLLSIATLALARLRLVGGVPYPSNSQTWELTQFSLTPFKLSHMSIGCEKDVEPLFKCSIEFDWDDPNANQSCTCNQSWQWNSASKTYTLDRGNHSTDYLACKNDKTEFFQFKFVDMYDLSNFSLSLTHMYRDIDNFPVPTNVNMFAQPNITLENMERSNTSMTYSAACNCTIDANITGMTI